MALKHTRFSAILKLRSSHLTYSQKSYASGTVLVTGANRGIGLEFCRQYAAKQFNIFACVRDPFNANDLDELKQSYPNQINVRQMCIKNDADIVQLSDSLKNIPIDILILNAGISGDKNNSDLGLLNREDLMNTLNVNCVSSLLVGQSLFENVKISKRKQIIGISSRMGSIADNEQSGGRVAYRVSKSALNSVFQEFKIKGREYGIHSFLLHPGWVQTSMGGKMPQKQ